jgi:hypothetical protein
MQQQAGSAVLRSEWDKTRWTTGIAHRFPSAGSRPGIVDFSTLFTISWASFKIPSLLFFMSSDLSFQHSQAISQSSLV